MRLFLCLGKPGVLVIDGPELSSMSSEPNFLLLDPRGSDLEEVWDAIEFLLSWEFGAL